MQSTQNMDLADLPDLSQEFVLSADRIARYQRDGHILLRGVASVAEIARIGAEVTFQVDAFPTATFQGRVSAIRLNTTTVQNVVTYSTVIDFENPEEKLLPGETAYITIPTGHAVNVIKVPNAALRFTPEMPYNKLQELYRRYHIPASATASHLGGWQVVWETLSDKQLEPVAVKVGITDYSFTQLLDGNLKEGSMLVTGEELARNASQPQGQFPSGPRFGGPRR